MGWGCCESSDCEKGLIRECMSILKSVVWGSPGDLGALWGGGGVFLWWGWWWVFVACGTTGGNSAYNRFSCVISMVCPQFRCCFVKVLFWNEEFGTPFEDRSANMSWIVFSSIRPLPPPPLCVIPLVGLPNSVVSSRGVFSVALHWLPRLASSVDAHKVVWRRCA